MEICPEKPDRLELECNSGLPNPPSGLRYVSVANRGNFTCALASKLKLVENAGNPVESLMAQCVTMAAGYIEAARDPEAYRSKLAFSVFLATARPGKSMWKDRSCMGE